jgi:D-amino peptidase
VLLVTGDEAACAEGREFFGEIETAAVKEGIGRQHARCLHPQVAREAIRAAARRAMERGGTIPPYRIDPPLTIRLEYYRSDMADAVARRPGTRRINARTVERVIDDPRLMMSF